MHDGFCDMHLLQPAPQSCLSLLFSLVPFILCLLHLSHLKKQSLVAQGRHLAVQPGQPFLPALKSSLHVLLSETREQLLLGAPGQTQSFHPEQMQPLTTISPSNRATTLYNTFEASFPGHLCPASLQLLPLFFRFSTVFRCTLGSRFARCHASFRGLNRNKRFWGPWAGKAVYFRCYNVIYLIHTRSAQLPESV